MTSMTLTMLSTSTPFMMLITIKMLNINKIDDTYNIEKINEYNNVDNVAFDIETISFMHVKNVDNVDDVDNINVNYNIENLDFDNINDINE